MHAAAVEPTKRRSSVAGSAIDARRYGARTAPWRYPTLAGYCLVAPVEHREGVVDDFTEDEYLALQRVVRRVGRAVSRAVPTERLYVLSLGSRDGNAHVHWHVAPLPPGVPYDDQQFRSLMVETAGYHDIPVAEQEDLAARIRRAIARGD
jgi:diadenosine tetraphosphate (Ap4A) HIT family hydrolase